MDSAIQRDGRLLDLTDDAWREDRLPYEDVTIPLSELPEAEQDNGGSTESVKEQEMKWTDLALQSLHENTPSTGSWKTQLTFEKEIMASKIILILKEYWYKAFVFTQISYHLQ